MHDERRDGESMIARLSYYKNMKSKDDNNNKINKKFYNTGLAPRGSPSNYSWEV